MLEMPGGASREAAVWYSRRAYLCIYVYELDDLCKEGTTTTSAGPSSSGCEASPARDEWCGVQSRRSQEQTGASCSTWGETKRGWAQACTARESAVSVNSHDSSGASRRGTPGSASNASLAGGLAEALRQRQQAMHGREEEDDEW